MAGFFTALGAAGAVGSALSAFRGSSAQREAIRLLRNRARGGGPSAAEALLGQQQEAIGRQNIGLATAFGGQGSQQQSAIRTALRANSQGQQQAAGQAASIRAQEQAQAQQQLLAAGQGRTDQRTKAFGALGALGSAAGAALTASQPAATQAAKSALDVGALGPKVQQASQGLDTTLPAQSFVSDPNKGGPFVGPLPGSGGPAPQEPNKFVGPPPVAVGAAGAQLGAAGGAPQGLPITADQAFGVAPTLGATLGANAPGVQAPITTEGLLAQVQAGQFVSDPQAIQLVQGLITKRMRGDLLTPEEQQLLQLVSPLPTGQ